MEELVSHAVYEFEGHRLDTRSRQLTALASQQCVPLKPKQYDTLLFFVERAGRVIDKTTLMDGIWRGLVVEENNLNQQISALRRVLGGARGGKPLILNVRGRGYQFVPGVVRLDRRSQEAMPADLSPARDAAAAQCYQHAIFRAGRDDPAEWSAAVDLLGHATAVDPLFGSALAMLAQLRIRLLSIDWPGSEKAMTLAPSEAARALELCPDLAFAHMAAGSVAAARGDWVEGERQFRIAGVLEEEWPIVGAAHSAHVLISVGHLGRALESARRSQVRGHGMIGVVLIHAFAQLLMNKDAEAAEDAALITGMGGQLHRPHIAEFAVRLAQRAGRFDEAARLVQQSLTRPVREAGGESVVACVVAALESATGLAHAVDAVDRLIVQVSPDSLPQPLRYQLLAWYTELGALDRAFSLGESTLDYLARRGTVGTTWAGLWLRETRLFREDRRFARLAARIGLAEYWDRFGPPDPV